jgi:hypothetical protein
MGGRRDRGRSRRRERVRSACPRAFRGSGRSNGILPVAAPLARHGPPEYHGPAPRFDAPAG